MKKLCTILCLFFVIQHLQAQTGKSNTVSSDYSRNALTLLLLDFNNSPYHNYLRNSYNELKVPEKFDDNMLEQKKVDPKFKKKPQLYNTFYSSGITDYSKQIEEEIQKNGLPKDIIRKWFSIDQHGMCNMSLIQERGRYDATDNEFLMANDMERGIDKLKDEGEKLINKSYILAFDYYKIMTMQQYYDSLEAKGQEDIKRNKNGFLAGATAYLYKIDFNDSITNAFYQFMYLDTNLLKAPNLNPSAVERKKNFEAAQFPIKFVMKVNVGKIESSQYNEGEMYTNKAQKSKQELFNELVEKSVNSAIISIEKKYDAFRVRTMVVSRRPIGAKIGKKEGLRFDQRFFVYENRVNNKTGKQSSKRVAVVRSKKIADNRGVAEGQTAISKFYQTAGKRIDNFGMFMEQKNDVGMGLLLGYKVGEISGICGRLELQLSTLLGYASVDLSPALTAFKLYIEGGYEVKSYPNVIDSIYTILNKSDIDDEILDSDELDYDFARFAIGLQKDIHFMRNLHLGFFAGGGLEQATWDAAEDEEKIDAFLLEGGARFGFNIRHNIQLIGSATYYMPFVASYYNAEDEEEELDEFGGYTDFFENRQGLSISGGIRIQF